MSYFEKEYTLRLVPPSPIYEDVLWFKEKFKNNFGKHIYANSKPHITLAVFRMETKFEEGLVNVLGKLSNEKCFSVEILGMGAFYNARVLLLEIGKSSDLTGLIDKIGILFNEELCDVVTKVFISKTPHMTISKVKDAKMLDESLELFRPNAYQNRFTVWKLVLTSRLLNQTWDWEVSIPLSE